LFALVSCWLAPTRAAEVSPPHSAPLSAGPPEARGRHPGQNGPLTPEQLTLARSAWRYFENAYEPATCLYDSVAGYPSTTLWDTASSVGGLVSAFELGLVTPSDFDDRLGCLLASLASLPLYADEVPNKAYHTQTLQAVNYANEPALIGSSAIDLGRLLTWLAIVKGRYPLHADAVDRVVLGWRFCNVLDDAGTLYGAHAGSDGVVRWLQEGRLGYEEYAAAGFQLWGFDATRAAAHRPFVTARVEGVAVAHDVRDPARYGALDAVVTEPYLLAAIELNWDRVTEPPESDLWTSDRVTRKHARRVYRAQERRWRHTDTLTARSEHHVDQYPWFVYDAVWADGDPWRTVAVDGHEWPTLSAVTTKTAVGMAVVFDTAFTDQLLAAVQPLVDPEQGILEGYYEATGAPIRTFTANTNGIVLETLLYKVQGKLLRVRGFPWDTLWDATPNPEFPGVDQCLPRATKRVAAVPR
jgi:hypothetical protein